MALRLHLPAAGSQAQVSLFPFSTGAPHPRMHGVLALRYLFQVLRRATLLPISIAGGPKRLEASADGYQALKSCWEGAPGGLSGVLEL